MATSTTNLGLIKPAGSDKIRIAQINQNSDLIDAAVGPVGSTNLQAQANALKNGMAIVSNNNTHAAITAGQYVYVYGHGTLSEGLYVATANIGANGSLSGSNLTAVSGGGLNALNAKIAKLNSDENTTTDILASALAATRTAFFKGSGSGYTGNIPAQSALNYGSFIVNVRNTYRYVIGVNTEGKVFTNVYGGSSWYGWQELALKSEISSIQAMLSGIKQTGVSSGIFSLRFTNDQNDHTMALLFSSNPTSDGYKVRLYDVTNSWNIVWQVQ